MIFPLVIVVVILLFSFLNVSSWNVALGNGYALHFFGYFILALSWMFYFRTYYKHPNYFIAVGITIVIGALVEAGQWFFPYRSFEYADMIANGLGALVAIPFYKYTPKKIKRGIRVIILGEYK